MASALSSGQIKQTREALGLSSSQFASVLGVHPTTVSRWENAKGPVIVEGMAYTVLSALQKRLAGNRRAKVAASRAGEEISSALVFGGVVIALALLVAFAAKQK